MVTEFMHAHTVECVSILVPRGAMLVVSNALTTAEASISKFKNMNENVAV